MPQTDPVVIPVKGDTKDAENKLKQLGSRFKELGGNLSQIGGVMTGMFTAPIVGGLAALGKYGSDASKTVNDLKKSLDEAIASGDPAKVQAAADAWNAIPAATREAAASFERVQAAIKPAQEALEGAASKLMVALVPAVERITPLLVTLAEKISGLVDWFAALPQPTQDVILGIVGVTAAAGPAMMAVGQLVTSFGSMMQVLSMAQLGSAIPQLITNINGVLSVVGLTAPALLAFVGALMAIDFFVKNVMGKSWGDVFRDAIESARELLVIVARVYDLLHFGLTDAAKETYDLLYGKRATGGPVVSGGAYLVGENGPEVLMMGANSGYVSPLTPVTTNNTTGGSVVMYNTFTGSPRENAREMEDIVRRMKRNGTI